MIVPVRWVKNRLEILDQRLLPYREKYLVCRTVDQVVEAIKSLAVRGAPLLGVTGAYAIALAKDRPAAAKKLIASRPTAVNLRWAVERTLQAPDPLAEARRIHAEDAAMCDAIARHGAPLLKNQRVLTICNTGALATGGIGTAFGVLLRAKATVYALETRPLRQGARLTMWEAEKCGLKARVLPDGAAAACLREKKIQGAIAGADRIARNGDAANKIGTFSVALACHALRVPFYIAAPSSTVDLACPNGAAIPIEERDGREVSDRFPAWNPAFDVTPARYITAFITERGILKPGAIKSL
ncbi:MAG TPA: S-methyl-5-thioribose-1-phosphate isomerase [Planctomycetota bacterium]|nr:S-methyl-5-thioribose-1-phosphate isomerase [Planctomycetota bacterium]